MDQAARVRREVDRLLQSIEGRSVRRDVEVRHPTILLEYTSITSEMRVVSDSYVNI
jgi:hypothetical protein